MNTSLDHLISLLRRERAASTALLAPPASIEALLDVQRRATSTFGVPLPDEYLAFLARMNGLVIGSLTVAGAGRQLSPVGDTGTAAPIVIPDVVAHAVEMATDYSPSLDGLLIVTYGSPLFGWDVARSHWVRAFYDSGRAGQYDSFIDLLLDGLRNVGIDLRV